MEELEPYLGALGHLVALREGDVGDYLEYTVTLTNEGQDTAFNVVVDNALSANATYDYAYSDEGDCNFIVTENTAVCPLGDTPSGQSKELTVWVVPNAKGTASNTATAFNDSGDSDPSNDTAKEETTVQGDGGGVEVAVAATAPAPRSPNCDPRRVPKYANVQPSFAPRCQMTRPISRRPAP